MSSFLFSEARRADRVFMLAAVRRNGYALCCASAALVVDRELALAAVHQNWRVLTIE